ncbi:EFR1 family ferrodoxin [Paenibacillus wynnii]|uniref:EFR1 family ferrodoxin n=1 Tax=Paenibacillus wynnii TaxID=268407 RepID=UPI0027926CF5|nr:EFR1 family ferrodoxin [Paenibacillus wynnii]MDQ0193026.1 flavodoxin/NAD-dependent dihydropyrimidine dehydrogenase PreA subunit [Paenibacillus wynnii]
MQNRKAAIFYFSGTGNTEIIAKRIADALERKDQRPDLFRIENILKGQQSEDYEAYGLIGIGHPVLGFGASGIVERFVEQLPDSGGTPTFVFKTASSPHYVNHGASNTVIRSLRNKGYDTFHNSIFAMPCNFFMKYDDRLNKQLYETALHKVEILAEEVLSRTPRVLRIHPVLEKALKMVYYFEDTHGGKAFAKGLKTTSSCTLCLKCVRDCPTSNIAEGKEGLSFGQECIWCMRCIYSCPHKAIQATKIRSCVVEPYTGGPALHKLLEDPDNDGQFVNERSTGYYKHFIDYIKQDDSV